MGKPCFLQEFPYATNQAQKNQLLTAINYRPHLDIAASA
jgi:hypothetical protein